MVGLILGWSLQQHRHATGFAVHAPSAPPGSRSGLPITDASEAHCLVVAPTGAGKGRNIIIPNLLHWQHSAIVVDVKGEAAMATARWRRALGQRVVVLDPFCRVSDGSDGLNPLDWLGAAHDQIADNATTLSEVLTGDSVGHKEPFWDHAANDFAAGLLAYAATSPNLARRQMAYLYNLITDDDSILAIATLLDSEPRMHPFARRQLASYLQHEADKVRTSVRSTAQQHLRLFANPLVQQSVAKTSFDLGALARGEPLTIYLVMPATRLQSHAGLLRMWLTVLLGVISERTAQPRHPTLLIVDELAQIGAIPLILQSLTLMRGYGLRVMAVLQSLAQLKSLWPNDHQTVIDNCGLIAAFGLSRPTMAGPVADLLGDLSASTLMQMPPEQLAVSRAGQPTVVARKLDYLHDGLFAGRADANPLYECAEGNGPVDVDDTAMSLAQATNRGVELGPQL